MASESNPTGQIAEFLRVLRRRRWQVLLPALCVLAIGSSFAVIVPKKYVVETTVEIRESRNPLDYDLKFRQESATAREIPNVREHIINYRRVQRIVGRDLIDLFRRYQRADREERGEMIKRIMRNIEVGVGQKTKAEGSTFIEVSYRDVDAERAERFLKELTRLWIEEVIEFDENRLEAERDVLKEALVKAREVYGAASREWIAQCRSMGWNPADAPTQQGFGRGAEDFVFNQLNTYREQQASTAEDLAQARTRLALLEESFRQEPAMLPQVQVQPAQSYEAQRAKIEREIADLERELGTITRHHHRYARLTDGIAERRALLAEIRQAETEATEVVTLVPNEHKEELRLALAEQRREVGALEESLARADENVERFERRVDRRGQDFGLLLSLWNDMTAAAQEKSDAERDLRAKETAVRQAKRANLDVYDIAKPPIPRDGTRTPSALLIVAFSLFVGLALGLVVALVAEYARDSYRTVTDLAEEMAVPVLGAIGTVLTGADQRRRFLRRLSVGGSLAVLVVALGWTTYTWYYSRDRLPLELLEAIEGFRELLM